MDTTSQHTDATGALKQPIATTQRNETTSQVAASQSLESTSSQLQHLAKVSKRPPMGPNVLKGPLVNERVRKYGTTRDGRVSNIQWARQQTPEKEYINHAIPIRGRSTSNTPLVQDYNLATLAGDVLTQPLQAKTSRLTVKLRTKPRKSKMSKGLERELRSILDAGGNSGHHWVRRRLRSRGAPSPEAQEAEAKQAKDDMEVDDYIEGSKADLASRSL